MCFSMVGGKAESAQFGWLYTGLQVACCESVRRAYGGPLVVQVRPVGELVVGGDRGVRWRVCFGGIVCC